MEQPDQQSAQETSDTVRLAQPWQSVGAYLTLSAAAKSVEQDHVPFAFLESVIFLPTTIGLPDKVQAMDATPVAAVTLTPIAGQRNETASPTAEVVDISAASPSPSNDSICDLAGDISLRAAENMAFAE